MVCGILLDQGSNQCLLHQQVNSLPLSHQGNPLFFALFLIRFFAHSDFPFVLWKFRLLCSFSAGFPGERPSSEFLKMDLAFSLSPTPSTVTGSINHTGFGLLRANSAQFCCPSLGSVLWRCDSLKGSSERAATGWRPHSQQWQSRDLGQNVLSWSPVSVRARWQ